jgi:hypothetical protein
LDAQHITPKRGYRPNNPKIAAYEPSGSDSPIRMPHLNRLGVSVFRWSEHDCSVPANQPLSPFQLHTPSDQMSRKNNYAQGGCYSQISLTLTHNRVQIESAEPYNDEQNDACSNP